MNDPAASCGVGGAAARAAWLPAGAAPQGRVHFLSAQRPGILNEPTSVFTSVPGGRAVVGRGRPLLATVHVPVADGQVTHPLLLQMSIEPSLLTDHAQRAPLAVLSIHLPTAVLPSMAEAGVDRTANTTTLAAKVMVAAQDLVRGARENISSSCLVHLSQRCWTVKHQHARSCTRPVPPGQGTPEALPYLILRRLSRPRGAALRLAPGRDASPALR